MTKKSEMKAAKAREERLAEARAGALRVTVKETGGQSEEVVRARLGFELNRAGLERGEDFDVTVKAISEGRQP